jgi:integrase
MKALAAAPFRRSARVLGRDRHFARHRPRDLPRTAAHPCSQLIDAGVDIVKISRRLGHANPTITLRIYAHLFRRRDDISAEAINTALADLNVSRS